MSQLISSDSLRNEALGGIFLTGGYLDAALQIVLVTSMPTDLDGLILGDLDQPLDYSGSVALPTPVWSPYLDSDGRTAYKLVPAVTFVTTGDNPGQTVVGYVVILTAGTICVFGELFDSPVPFGLTGQSIDVTPRAKTSDSPAVAVDFVL